MKRGRKVLLIMTFLCLALVIYRNMTGEKERKRTPEDGTDSEFYLYFGEEDAERIDTIILRKLIVGSDNVDAEAEIEITDQDMIQEIAKKIWTLKLTEDEEAEENWIGENKMIISFNTGGPDLTLYMGSGNRLKRELIACGPDTKMTVYNSVLIMEPEIDFDELWEMAEAVIPETETKSEPSKEEMPVQTSESNDSGNVYINEESDDRAAFDSLSEVPYLSYLDQYSETGIEVDMRQAEPWEGGELQ